MFNYTFKAYYSLHTEYSKTPKIVSSHVLDSYSVRTSSGAQVILRFLVFSSVPPVPEEYLD